MARPFVILSLPRSRSAWTAFYLSYGTKRCGHDTAIDCRSIGDFVSRFQTLDGTAETGAVLGIDAIKALIPNVKLLLIRRPIAEVQASLLAHGIIAAAGDLEAKDAALEALEREGIPSVTFDQLRKIEPCRFVFEYCLRLPFDLDWWLRVSQVNIQVNIPERLAVASANRTNIEAMKAEAIHYRRAG